MEPKPSSIDCESGQSNLRPFQVDVNESFPSTEKPCSKQNRSKRKRPGSPTACSRRQRTKWDQEQDKILVAIIKPHMKGDMFEGKWPEVAATIGRGRTGKQCRDRWVNYLRPGINKGRWSKDDVMLLEDMHEAFGPRWKAMATIFQNRTDNDVKNKWNSMNRHKKRRLRDDGSLSDKSVEHGDADDPLRRSVSNEDDEDYDTTTGLFNATK